MSESFDCMRCGACCAPKANWRTYVEVTPRELARLPAKFALNVLDGELRTVRRKGGVRCIALRGELGESVRCEIHALRPHACRAFAVGSPNCLEARAEVLGWAAPPSALLTPSPARDERGD